MRHPRAPPAPLILGSSVRATIIAMFLAIPSQLGYGALGAFVFAESAGVPVPGETALVAAGLLTRSGQLSLVLVVAIAAAAAMLGDNLGYWIGRRGGRRLLERDGRTARHRRRALAKGDTFFARHGAKAVFFGRWITGVRVVAAVIAGASHMPWGTFALYNAAGAIAWSATVAGVASLVGPAGAAVIYGAGLTAAFGTGAWIAARAWIARRRTHAAGLGSTA